MRKIENCKHLPALPIGGTAKKKDMFLDSFKVDGPRRDIHLVAPIQPGASASLQGVIGSPYSSQEVINFIDSLPDEPPEWYIVDQGAIEVFKEFWEQL